MPANIIYDLGTVTMSDDLIASIAGTAAVENYGIVAMNSKSATDALLQHEERHRPRHAPGRTRRQGDRA